VTEENGSRDSRMDRIERALELFIADHEQFRHDHKQLLRAQVLQQDEINGLLKIAQAHTVQLEEQGRQLRELGEGLNERIDKLVSGFGEYIRNQGRSPS
jgi:hypothetical protein